MIIMNVITLIVNVIEANISVIVVIIVGILQWLKCVDCVCRIISEIRNIIIIISGSDKTIEIFMDDTIQCDTIQ